MVSVGCLSGCLLSVFGVPLGWLLGVSSVFVKCLGSVSWMCLGCLWVSLMYFGSVSGVSLRCRRGYLRCLWDISGCLWVVCGLSVEYQGCLCDVSQVSLKVSLGLSLWFFFWCVCVVSGVSHGCF